MSASAYYAELLRTINDADVRRVFDVLRAHVGQAHKISLDDLCRQVFGVYNENTNRKTRKIIEILRRDYRIAVLSNSGQAGRWLAESKSDIDQTVAELESRRENIGEVIKSLRQARVPPSEAIFERPTAVQQSFLNEWR